MKKVRTIKIGARKKRRVLGDINVTPLIDVVLVLLIIFMVVTPLLEQQLVVETPSTEAVDARDAPEQLIVNVLADGTWQLNDEPVAEDALRARLEGKLADAKTKVVFFKAHDDAPYKSLARALGQGRATGAALGFAVEE